jgi:hypothetical protein
MCSNNGGSWKKKTRQQEWRCLGKINIGWDLLQWFHDEVEPAIRGKGESKGKKGLEGGEM